MSLYNLEILNWSWTIISLFLKKVLKIIKILLKKIINVYDNKCDWC